MPDSSEEDAGRAELASKEESLINCAEKHKALLLCFKESSLFGWNCKEQHEAFWDCYRKERGMDANIVGDALSRWHFLGRVADVIEPLGHVLPSPKWQIT
ncbi:hypothetical protein WJX75_001515 [Coccomyxa subellipsoidea]|uniref:CHCH domain-containing protein n=1 Tax=Coccomyxa subellipsoidea TaxID=248742 RepID=A0ABR2YZR8_9CHLO